MRADHKQHIRPDSNNSLPHLHTQNTSLYNTELNMLSDAEDERNPASPTGELPWKYMWKLEHLWTTTADIECIRENCRHYGLPTEGLSATLRATLYLHLCGITESHIGAERYKSLHKESCTVFHPVSYASLSWLNKIAKKRFPNA